MGKRLISQRRGRGTGPYKSPGHRFKGKIALPKAIETNGEVLDIIHCAGHSAPLISVIYDNDEKTLTPAPQGIKVGDKIEVGKTKDIKAGNILELKDIPEGTSVYNLELKPGDGGKFCRASGTFAKVVAKTSKQITIKLPSKKEKHFLPACRAVIGTVAGSGRTEKPFLKAGTRMFAKRARNKLYPRVYGISMNAVDHPFGGTGSHHKGRPDQSSRHDPPGRKAGKIAPSRTGKKL